MIFFIVMIPNIIWFVVPAPNDILRAESVTAVIDTIASVCQVLMIISLCVFINKEKSKLSVTPLIIGMVVCVLLYFASWILYYMGMTNAIIILGLTISPCLVFLLYAIDRKNRIAVISTLIFTICHLVYSVVNFIV